MIHKNIITIHVTQISNFTVIVSPVNNSWIGTIASRIHFETNVVAQNINQRNKYWKYKMKKSEWNIVKNQFKANDHGWKVNYRFLYWCRRTRWHFSDLVTPCRQNYCRSSQSNLLFITWAWTFIWSVRSPPPKSTKYKIVIKNAWVVATSKSICAGR